MPFGFGGGDKTGQEKIMGALITLRERTQTLNKAVKPEPSKIGLIGAGTIGAKAENVRQGINSSATQIRNVAREQGGKLDDKDVLEIYDFFQDHMVELIEETLARMSTVHYHRFCELGMGIPSVVKMALGWFISSDKAFNSAYEDAVGNPKLLPQVKELNTRILTACEKAHRAYSGIPDK